MMKRGGLLGRAVRLGVLGCWVTLAAADPLPLFDAHMHHNWEPVPRFTTQQVLQLFRQHHISGVLATSRPNIGTHALMEAQARDVWVVPFIRPYQIRADIQTWFSSAQTMPLIEAEFRRGNYRGIGEFHLHGQDARQPVVRQVVAFARQHRLFLHAHSDETALEILFQHDPEARIIWAHTGFTTPPARVDALLRRYPGLTAELSYTSGMLDAQGQLTPAWRQLLLDHPRRFLVGSDTWTDERWERYGELMEVYRRWLAQLPPAVAEQIAHRNARALFGTGD